MKKTKTKALQAGDAGNKKSLKDHVLPYPVIKIRASGMTFEDPVHGIKKKLDWLEFSSSKDED